MSSLPLFLRDETGRFDFRVPDGLGNYVLPDLDDPDLKVEFRDSQGTLCATAAVGGSPAIVTGDDYDEDANPQGGVFVAVEAIPLSGFAAGVAEARIYVKVLGVPVQPYPTILEAFEVIADAAEGPLYATVEAVRSEVPGDWPDEITGEAVVRAIAEASRRIDAALAACYEVPFAAVADSPATPVVIESICRRLAAHQCLLLIGRVSLADVAEPAKSALMDLANLCLRDGRSPASRLPGYRGPLAVYGGTLHRADAEAGSFI